MRDSPVYAGSDYIGIRRTETSVARVIDIVLATLARSVTLCAGGVLVSGWGRDSA